MDEFLSTIGFADDTARHAFVSLFTEQKLAAGEVLFYCNEPAEKLFFIKTFQGPKFFQVSHMLDIAIHVWTINDPGDMFRLLDWGVDGIFSDNPKLLQEIVDFKFRKK